MVGKMALKNGSSETWMVENFLWFWKKKKEKKLSTLNEEVFSASKFK